MFAICIESSHQRGMGHLYRALNMVQYLKDHQFPFILIMNNDDTAIRILKSNHIPFVLADLLNTRSNWESELIRQYHVTVWINDRLDTEYEHARNVLRNKVKLVNFDDRGSGASLSHLNISGLTDSNVTQLNGSKVLQGLQYLILNPEIKKFQKQRYQIDRILVTLGGSDTHCVTEKIMAILRQLNRKATIILGPSSTIRANVESDEFFTIKRHVPSLIEEFYNYDLAITGGGITPFEANASGLPCLIVSNEDHEIETANMLQAVGSSIYLGHHSRISISDVSFDVNVEQMSRSGLENIKVDGIEKVFEAIMR